MTNFKGICICLLFLFSHLATAQVEQEEQSLELLISRIEKQFECSFSYADAQIEGVKLRIPSSLTTLEELVRYLQDNTSLAFTLLEGRVVAIGPKKETFSICGYFLDIDTGEGISDVTINTQNASTITDQDGYFELQDIAATALVSIKHLTYKAVKYVGSDFSEGNCNRYYLVPNIELIREITIRNYLTKGIKKSTTGSFEIDYTNFGILPGLIEADVLQTIQSFPGVQSVDETVSNINIRGGSHSENLLLFDGIKMFQSGHFFGLISAFNPYLTKSASLIKNGTSAHLTDGVSGTILMRTNSEVNHSFAAEFGLNMINADALVDFPIGNNSSVQLSARKSINEVWQTPTYKQYFDKAFQDTEVIEGSEDVLNTDDEFSFYDVNVRWLYDPTGDDKIRVNLLKFSNNLVFLENAIVDDVEQSKESSAIQDNTAASVFYKRDWSDYFNTEFQLYSTKYKLESINHDILNDQRVIQENEVIEHAIRLDSEYTINSKLTWFNGYQYFETGIVNIQDVDNPLFYKRVKEVIRSHGLSSQIAYQSERKSTHFRVGLRLNYIEKFAKILLEPRLSFSHKFANYFNVEVLGELKHQSTSQIIDFQEDFLGVENRRWILANDEDIPIVQGKQLSSGVHFNKKGWLISAEGYYKFVDGISSQSQGFQNQYQYEKTVGSYRVYGVDFLVNKRFKRISTWFSYSYADNEYTFQEFDEVYFPNNLDITHTISLAANYAVGSFKVSAGLNWHSGKPTTEPVSGNEIVDGAINYEDANSSRLEDYMRVDLSAQYGFQIGRKAQALTSISIWNLLNQENQINSYYRISDENTVDEVIQTSLGLTPNVSFRVRF